MLRKSPLFFGLLVIFSSSAALANVSSKYYDQQLHVMLGAFSGGYRGYQVSSSFVQPDAIRIEYERILKRNYSAFVHTQIVFGLDTGKMNYFNIGAGIRYYLQPNAMAYSLVEGGLWLNHVPKWRAYIGTEVNLSQVLVKNVTELLTISPAVLEGGGHLGCIYQVSPLLGLEGQVGLSVGYSLSTVSLFATGVRIQGGVSYFF